MVAVNQQQVSKKSNAWQSFKTSSWVTVGEEWLMGFVGRAVNVVLMVTILYSCAEIYVSLPASINLAMFLVQMAALDVGGYGLTTLARVARREGDTDGADKAEWLGRGLVVVMIVSVVIAGLEQKVAIPDEVKVGVDLALIVIRSVCSVLYGRVVHALKTDHQTGLQSVPAPDVFEYLTAFTETLDRRFSEMKSETESRLQMTETRLSETLHRLMSESEARFSETLQTFTETPEDTFTESLSETLQAVVKAQMEEELHPVYDALQAHASILEALSGLPSQQAQLSVIIREVKATIERIPSFSETGLTFTERPKLLSLKAGVKVSEVKPPVSTKASESFTEASLKETSESGFDKKAFVLACFTESASMTIGEIQRRAEAIGQSVSVGYVSSIRKALVEEQSA